MVLVSVVVHKTVTFGSMFRVPVNNGIKTVYNYCTTFDGIKKYVLWIAIYVCICTIFQERSFVFAHKDKFV